MWQRASRRFGRPALGATFVLTMGLAESLYGDITGQNVVVGNAIFTPTATGWVIKPSNGAIIEYSSFGVNANELIKFIQTSSDARVLNRVLGDFPTNIDGRLQSNGIVYIVNPAGVFIGPDGVVDVGGIYAAAGSISNTDFLTGTDTFAAIGGRVENRGLIKADAIAALIGTGITNSGTVQTGPGGLTALLASTGSVRLIPTDIDGKVFVDVAIMSDPASNPGTDTGVLNSGKALAGTAGQLLLGAGDVYSLAIHNTAASTARTPGGIVLMQGQRIRQDGVLSGGRLTVNCESFGVDHDFNFDRARINGDLDLARDITFRAEGGGTAQWFTIRGDLRSEAGEYHSFTSFATQHIIHGDIGAGAGQLGTLSLYGDAGLADDVMARDGVLITGNTLFYDGNRDQQIVCENGDVRIGGNFIKLGEMLLIEGENIEFGGDGFAVKDLTVRCGAEGSITMNGAGDQRLLSHTRITLDGDAVKTTSGMFHIGAIDIAASKDVINQAGDLIFAGIVDFNGVGDQRASATGGDLHFMKGAHKSTAGRLDVAGETIFVHEGVATDNGDLAFSGRTEFVGSGTQGASAGGLSELSFSDDVTKSTDGALFLIANWLRFGGDAQTTNGSLTLGGFTTLDGVGDQTIRAAGGELQVGGDIEKTTGGDLVLASDERIALDGDAESRAGSLRIDTPEVILTNDGTQRLLASADVSWNAPLRKEYGDLRIISEGDGRIEVGGDVIVERGRLLFRGPLLLQLDATAEGDRVTFDGSIDGPFALVVNADERITFLGDIGMNTDGGKGQPAALRSLALRAGELIEFGNGNGTSVRVDEFVSFNGDLGDVGAIPQVATIGSAGDLRVECAEFLMGPRQKLTILGTLDIDAGQGAVTLGDVNVLNDLIVQAGAIQLRSREAGQVLSAGGVLSDEGMDIVVGGAIDLSAVPIVLGDGTVRFASFDPNADVNGTLSGFSLELLGEPVSLESLRLGETYFDLTIPPPLPDVISTVSPATALAADDPDEAGDEMESDRMTLRENERVALNGLLGPAVNVRRQIPRELARGGAGTVVFDAGESAPSVSNGILEVAAPRLSRDAAVRFLRAHAQLAAMITSSREARQRAEAVLARIGPARPSERGSILAQVRRGESQSDASLATAIFDALRWGEAIGFSAAERAAAGSEKAAFPESAVRALIEG
jgi:filamentous hemagglutinin family protein